MVSSFRCFCFFLLLLSYSMHLRLHVIDFESRSTVCALCDPWAQWFATAEKWLKNETRMPTWRPHTYVYVLMMTFTATDDNGTWNEMESTPSYKVSHGKRSYHCHIWIPILPSVLATATVTLAWTYDTTSRQASNEGNSVKQCFVIVAQPKRDEKEKQNSFRTQWNGKKNNEHFVDRDPPCIIQAIWLT